MEITFGAFLRQKRQEKNLTQKELARRTGIPINTIIKWESNQTIKPQMINYGKFIDFCEINNIKFEN